MRLMWISVLVLAISIRVALSQETWFGNPEVSPQEFDDFDTVDLDESKAYGFTFTIPYDECKMLQVTKFGLYSPVCSDECGLYEVAMYDTQTGYKIGAAYFTSVGEGMLADEEPPGDFFVPFSGHKYAVVAKMSDGSCRDGLYFASENPAEMEWDVQQGSEWNYPADPYVDSQDAGWCEDNCTYFEGTVHPGNYFVTFQYTRFDLCAPPTAVVQPPPAQPSAQDTFILCEEEDGDITCPEGQFIEIIHANYGRTSTDVCEHSAMSDTSCTDDTHTQTLRNECNGKTECAVWARNSFWGDTCYGTFKYLEVDYACGPPDDVGTTDECPDDPEKTEPGECGCGYPDIDSDEDGSMDCHDQCPEDCRKTEPGVCGCGIYDNDTDYDGVPDCIDYCYLDRFKTEPGECGCGNADIDTDGDGTLDCNDKCPNDCEKTEPGYCGCGERDIDSDWDNVPDCIDNCNFDPHKTEPGVCGCGRADIDSDEDGTPDCYDNCPSDCQKTEPGDCGCGERDTDSDWDNVSDCIDNCDLDPHKTEPGQCGCGNADTDTDGDGIADCIDECPDDANLVYCKTCSDCAFSCNLSENCVAEV